MGVDTYSNRGDCDYDSDHEEHIEHGYFTPPEDTSFVKVLPDYIGGARS